mmetsp:Transcript_8719/g.32613  ORF Transcript_8719/g.32613 Transcript_8719/m.32613 type:complete len:205 (+) Transcript_8719:897-1511(+)
MMSHRAAALVSSVSQGLGAWFFRVFRMPSGDGDACYFPRDLGRGSYGGDVHCLQRFLTRKGYLLEEPTGYFGDRTAAATKRWQRDNGVDSVDGTLEPSSRDKYALLHGLPLPGSGRITSGAGPDQKNTCVDVCSEFTGVRDCQTRCAVDKKDKKHACREACQTSFGSACDRAFPASGEGGSTNFKICLSYMSASCEDTCGKFRN